jgi:serine/threonine protein kinase
MIESDVRFFAASMVLILECLHAKSIVHRDVKAENFFIDAQGYLRLGDFEHAKELKGQRAFSLCGTREFMAPEMVSAGDHGYDFS